MVLDANIAGLSQQARRTEILRARNMQQLSDKVDNGTASAETIFVASTTTDFHGSAGTSTNMAWVATTNNTSYIDSFTDSDTLITAEGDQEWDVHASVWCTNSTVNDRAIYLMRLVHETLAAAEIYSYILGGTYICDDNNAYDSGGVGGYLRLFVSDGDRIKVQMYVVDTQNAAGSAPADDTYSKLKIDRITYV